MKKTVLAKLASEAARPQPAEAPASEWAMGVWNMAVHANLTTPDNPYPAAAEAAASIIEQAFAEREAAAEVAGFRRGVEAAEKAAHNAICDYGLKGGRLSYGAVSAIGCNAIAALLETQEAG